MPAAVEELLRFDSPVERAITRWAATDVELGGHTIARGELVDRRHRLREPRSRPVPRRRHARPVAARTCEHVGFGRGSHYCLGAPLARLEAEIALATLFAPAAAPAARTSPGRLVLAADPALPQPRLAACRLGARRRSLRSASFAALTVSPGSGPPPMTKTRPPNAATPSPCRGVGRSSSCSQRCDRRRGTRAPRAIVPAGSSPPTETMRPATPAAAVPPRGSGTGGSRRQRRSPGRYDSKWSQVRVEPGRPARDGVDDAPERRRRRGARAASARARPTSAACEGRTESAFRASRAPPVATPPATTIFRPATAAPAAARGNGIRGSARQAPALEDERAAQRHARRP